MADVIEVKDLTKRYGSLTAVDGISFSVAHGEIFGLLGPNGAGKSTTISMLCTITRPTSGTAIIDGSTATTSAITRAVCGSPSASSSRTRAWTTG